MAALGFFEIMMLIASNGGPNHDVASMVPIEAYCKARDIKLDAPTMIGLASTDPKDGKTQIQQLIALRWLRDHPAETKKVRDVKDLLGEIASGQKALDPQGFSKYYAQQVLARLDGKPIPVDPMPAGSVSKEALSWFPADFNFGAAIELRPSGKTWADEKDPVSELVAKLWKQVPEREHEQLYQIAEMVGNIRLDRVSFGLQFGPMDDDPERISIRFTGACDRKRLADVIAKTSGMEAKQMKGPKDEAITYFAKENRPPVMAFVGENDFLMVGYGKHMGNHMEVLEALLAVRSGKEKAMPAGELADSLKGVPEGARASLAVNITERMRQDMLRGNPPFKAVPQKVLAYATRGEKLTIEARMTMKDGDEAKGFAASLEDLKKMALMQMDKAPAEIPKEFVKMVKDTLNGVTIEATGATVKARVTLPSEKVISEAFKYFFGWSRHAPDQPPPPPPPDKP